jgi:hypothetical protein
MHQIDEFWNVYITQLASVQNMEKGKGRRRSFSEAIREQFFKALGILYIQELRIRFLEIKEHINESPPPKLPI